MNTRTNTVWNRTTIIATLAAVAGTMLVPGIASAQSTRDRSQQNEKNLMRNLGIGLGAAAVVAAVKGQRTNALILGAGAALAGTRYESDRKAQSRDNDGYYRYDRRDDHSYDNRRSDDYRPTVWNGDRRDNSGYDPRDRNHDDNRQNCPPQWRGNRNSDNDRQHQDNGRHNGWDKADRGRRGND